MKKFIKSLLFVFICFSQCSFADDVGLKEKIGQMIMVGFNGYHIKPDDMIAKAILAQNVGGVILFDYNYTTKTFERNIQTPKQVAKLTHELQDYAKIAAKNKHNIVPLFIGIDYEGGKVVRLGEQYGFPKTLTAEELGKRSRKDIEQQARQMAATLKQEGINVDFAPDVDLNINNNPETSVIAKKGRSFGNDPSKVTEYADIFSKAFQDNGILCAYKHFPGHGSAVGDTHEGFVDVTKTWTEEELKPYKRLFKKNYHCPMVMNAHVVNQHFDQYPSSISHIITKKLLREKLHFDGVVITDDMQMKAISEHYGIQQAVRLAINAGADILVFGNSLVDKSQDPQELVEMIYADVKAGKISEQRINESYQRIMKLKARLL